MQVEFSHHIDASEADAEGFYEYYYEYDIYCFTLGGLSLVVRKDARLPGFITEFVSFLLDDPQVAVTRASG